MTMVLMDVDATVRRPVLLIKEHNLKRPVVRHRTSSTRLRSNLLRKLGIPPASSRRMQQQRISSTTPPAQHAVSLLGKAKVERVPLKSNDEDDDRMMISSSSSLSSSHHRHHPHTATDEKVLDALGSHMMLWSNSLPQAATTTITRNSQTKTANHKRSVHFDPQAHVVAIPSRHEYSTRTSRFLWDTPERMHVNIIRNTLEYRADGWDWQTALEEDEHYYSHATQEYIHPIHMEIADMPPEEQALFVPATYINPALSLLMNHDHGHNNSHNNSSNGPLPPPPPTLQV